MEDENSNNNNNNKANTKKNIRSHVSPYILSISKYSIFNIKKVEVVIAWISD